LIKEIKRIVTLKPTHSFVNGNARTRSPKFAADSLEALGPAGDLVPHRRENVGIPNEEVPEQLKKTGARHPA
jgi:hypothetical protein